MVKVLHSSETIVTLEYIIQMNFATCVGVSSYRLLLWNFFLMIVCLL